MDPTHLMTQTATITRVTNGVTVDDYGNPVEATTTATAACFIHQTRRFEEQVDASTADETWTGYFPADVDLTADDRVTVDGHTYELTGPPWPAFNPRDGAVAFVEATLRRTS